MAILVPIFSDWDGVSMQPNSGQWDREGSLMDTLWKIPPPQPHTQRELFWMLVGENVMPGTVAASLQ